MYTGLRNRVDNLNEELLRTKELMGLISEQEIPSEGANKLTPESLTEVDTLDVPDGVYGRVYGNSLFYLTNESNEYTGYVVSGAKLRCPSPCDDSKVQVVGGKITLEYWKSSTRDKGIKDREDGIEEDLQHIENIKNNKWDNFDLSTEEGKKKQSDEINTYTVYIEKDRARLEKYKLQPQETRTPKETIKYYENNN